MNVDFFEQRAETPEPSIWRLGDVLEELLGQYGLADTCAAAEGRATVCGETGLFSAADLPTVSASAY